MRIVSLLAPSVSVIAILGCDSFQVHRIFSTRPSKTSASSATTIAAAAAAAAAAAELLHSATARENPSIQQQLQSQLQRQQQEEMTAGTKACGGTSDHPTVTEGFDGILFDIDGTLVNSDPLHFRVFQELLLKQDGFHNNQPIDEAYFRKNIAGRQNQLIMKDLFPEWTVEQRVAWSDHKEQRFREIATASTFLKDNAMKGLDKIKAWIEERNLPHAAVTNAPRLNAVAMLEGIGCTAFFPTLIIGDECEHAKPHPCPYLTGSDRIKVAAQRCIVFEDSPSGARAGVAAGAYVIGVLSGQEESTLMEAGCAMTIRDYEDPKLWDHLKSLEVASSSAPSQEK